MSVFLRFLQINQISLKANSFYDQQKTNFETSKIKGEIDKNCHILNVTSQKNENVSNELANVKLLLKTLTQKIEGLQFESETNNESFKNVSSNLTTLADNTRKDEEKSILDVESNRQTFNESTNNLTTTMNNHKLAIEQDLETNKEQFSETEKIIKANFDVINVDLNQIESNATKLIHNTESQTDDLFNDLRNIERQRTEQESDNVAGILQTIMDGSDRLNLHNVELTCRNNIAEENVRKYTTQTNNSILDCLWKLDHFKSDEIRTYRPTGINLSTFLIYLI